ncbi:hypothetical protein KJ966_30805 [bacterium]|nr:hypothetical protein [bacterium]
MGLDPAFRKMLRNNNGLCVQPGMRVKSTSFLVLELFRQTLVFGLDDRI